MKNIILAIIIMLPLACSSNSPKILPTPVGELKALDSFWKMLAGDTETNEQKNTDHKGYKK